MISRIAKFTFSLWVCCPILIGSGSLYADDTSRGTLRDVSSATSYLQRPGAQEFLDKLSRESGIERSWLADILAQANYRQDVIDAMSRPAERTLNWASYRPIFLTEKRLQEGREFMREHAEILQRAQQTYGVPASVISAIIGVETFYGRVTGSHSVIDALATLAFDYPPRAEFFRSELAEFLILSHVEGWDANQRKGSYAGAMGVPQFISSSYREYAVDFDQDGQRDLFGSMSDVIGSVANYLAVHGWQVDAPVAAPWSFAGEVVPEPVRALQQKSLKPAIRGEQIAALGFDDESLEAGTANDEPVSVMILEGEQGEEVWVGYRNFYVITRYNHSQLYAMAVWQLSQGLQQSLENRAQ